MKVDTTIKINYTTPDGTRTQATVDYSLVELWAEANQAEPSARAVADQVVARALKTQPADLTATRRIERQLIADTREALKMDWEPRDAFVRWCRHYGYDPESEAAKLDYAEYQRKQQLFNDLDLLQRGAL